jgi:hypothetical protein
VAVATVSSVVASLQWPLDTLFKAMSHNSDCRFLTQSAIPEYACRVQDSTDACVFALRIVREKPMLE